MTSITHLQSGFGSALPSQGEYVEWDEEPVEEVVGEDCVERRDLEAEDVVQVVEVVQMLRHKVLQTVQTPVAAKYERERNPNI